MYNPKYEEMWTPALGPQNPRISDFHKASKNTLNGFVEPATVNDFQFENQRQTFNIYGYAYDPSFNANQIIGDVDQAVQNNSKKKKNFLRFFFIEILTNFYE